MRSILRSLPAAFRRRGLRIAATLVLRAVLNLAGLAALLPVLTLVLDPAGFEGDGPLATVYVWSGVASPRTFALAVCGAVVGFIVLKCGVNFLLARAERRYIYDLYRTLSRRLYIAYHDRGLAFINNSNSSVLARNVNVVCLAFASSPRCGSTTRWSATASTVTANRRTAPSARSRASWPRPSGDTPTSS